MKTREQVAEMAKKAIERREALLEELGQTLRMAKDDAIWWTQTEELNRTLGVADMEVSTLLGVLEVEEAEMLATLLNDKKEREDEIN